jgi:hypothetical protein
MSHYMQQYRRVNGQIKLSYPIQVSATAIRNFPFARSVDCLRSSHAGDT